LPASQHILYFLLSQHISYILKSQCSSAHGLKPLSVMSPPNSW
jgi:hypothetical protein